MNTNNDEQGNTNDNVKPLDDKNAKEKIDTQNEEKAIEKKIKLNEQSNLDYNTSGKISRKMSDDLMKIFERIPEQQINKLLDIIKEKNSPDMQVRVNVQDFIKEDDEFILENHDDIGMKNQQHIDNDIKDHDSDNSSDENKIE